MSEALKGCRYRRHVCAGPERCLRSCERGQLEDRSQYSGGSKGGAPRKVPGGLTEVLYVRVDRQLLDDLDELRAEWSRERGHVLSRADVVRALLREGVVRC
jgi:hypothetical protein